MAQQCSDCYNGCVEITTDKCIRYTGVDNNVLGIKNGDSLSYVEQALVSFLSSTLDGTGIKLDIDEEIICNLVSQYLQECDDLTALELFKALIQAACSLQTQLDAVVADIATIEANYTVDCLSGVAAGDGTHAILQAVITKLCETDDVLTALALDLDTNYVKLSNLNGLIQAYLDNIDSGTKYYTRMVPYSPIPYVGSLSGFDITGAGSGDWEQIYLCNGLNSTPDFRGRMPVGAIINMGGGVLDATVDPAADPTFNPNYGLLDTEGTNKITLVTAQIPVHTHTATSTDAGHTHLLVAEDVVDTTDLTALNQIAEQKNAGSDANQYLLKGSALPATLGLSSESNAIISTTNDNTGGGEAHDNKQPSIATYWIIYIPN